MEFLLFMGFLLNFAFGFSVGYRIGDEPEETETYRRGTEPKQKYEGYDEFRYDCLEDLDEHIPRID